MGSDLRESHTPAALWRGFAEETGGREAHGGCCLSLARRQRGPELKGGLESASSMKPSLVACPPSDLSSCPSAQIVLKAS